MLALSFSAKADLITLDAYDYALGTNLSDVSEGVWIQQFQKLPNQPVTFSDVFASAYSTDCSRLGCNPTRDDFYLIGTETGGLSSLYSRADGRPLDVGGGGTGLIVRFDRPTNFVSIESYARNDMTLIFAYDLLGNYLGYVQQYASEYSGSTVIDHYGSKIYKSTTTFSSDIDNIAYVILGGNSAATGIGSLTYSVPEPGSLALLAAGLVGIVTVRRQRRLR